MTAFGRASQCAKPSTISDRKKLRLAWSPESATHAGRLGEEGVEHRNVGLAEKYRSWSQEVAFEHPFTANMLEQIAASYDNDAKWWDNQDSVRQRLED